MATSNLAQVNAARTQFVDANGAPLSGGTVTTYIPGTTTTVTTYQDASGQTANTNPITLDNLGSASIWWSGLIRMVVKDAAGNQIYDQVGGAGATGGIQILVLDTINSLSSTFVASFVTTIRASGYFVAGDIGKETTWTRTNLANGSPGTRRSLDGQNWILTTRDVRIEMFGGMTGTDCTAAFTELTNFLISIGGGGVEVVKGRQYSLTNAPPGVNMRYYGGGTLSLKENGTNTAAIFFSYGFARGTYYARNWKVCNNATRGNFITLTTPSDANHFPVGSLIIAISTNIYQVGNDWQPSYGMSNKVIASDPVTGNVELEMPMQEDWGGIQMALYQDWASGSPPPGWGQEQWAINCVWEDITFDLTAVAPSTYECQALAINGWYRSEVRNCRFIQPTAVFSNNGVCHSTWRNNIVYKWSTDSGNGGRILEIKTGSYNSQFYNTTVHSWYSITNVQPAVETGEYAAHITIDGVILDAPQYTCSYVYMNGTSGTPGSDIIFENFDFTVNGCNAFISIAAPNAGVPKQNYSEHIFRNCVINAPVNAQTLRLSPVLASVQFVADNIVAIQPNANGGSITATPAAIAVYDVLNYANCAIRKVQSNGPIFFNSANPYTSGTLSIRDCMVSTVSAANTNVTTHLQPYQIDLWNISRYNETLMRAGQVEKTGADITVNAASPTSVGTSAFPPYNSAFVWANGDGVRIDYSFFVRGSLGTKTITLYDADRAANVFSITIPQVSDGNVYRIIGEIYRFDAATYSGTVSVEGGGSNTATVYDVPSNASPSQMNFILYASVTNTSDSVVFQKTKMKFLQKYKDIQ
jgi:hypothetical protein